MTGCGRSESGGGILPAEDQRSGLDKANGDADAHTEQHGGEFECRGGVIVCHDPRVDLVAAIVQPVEGAQGERRDDGAERLEPEVPDGAHPAADRREKPDDLPGQRSERQQVRGVVAEQCALHLGDARPVGGDGDYLCPEGQCYADEREDHPDGDAEVRRGSRRRRGRTGLRLLDDFLFEFSSVTLNELATHSTCQDDADRAKRNEREEQVKHVSGLLPMPCSQPLMTNVLTLEKKT